MTEHHKDCGWHLDQYPWECNCGAVYLDHKSRIEALTAENERLREALRVLRDLPIVENDNPDTLHLDGTAHTGPAVDYLFRVVRKIKEVARAALAGKAEQ